MCHKKILMLYSVKALSLLKLYFIPSAQPKQINIDRFQNVLTEISLHVLWVYYINSSGTSVFQNEIDFFF